MAHLRYGTGPDDAVPRRGPHQPTRLDDTDDGVMEWDLTYIHGTFTDMPDLFESVWQIVDMSAGPYMNNGYGFSVFVRLRMYNSGGHRGDPTYARYVTLQALSFPNEVDDWQTQIRQDLWASLMNMENRQEDYNVDILYYDHANVKLFWWEPTDDEAMAPMERNFRARRDQIRGRAGGRRRGGCVTERQRVRWVGLDSSYPLYTFCKTSKNNNCGIVAFVVAFNELATTAAEREKRRPETLRELYLRHSAPGTPLAFDELFTLSDEFGVDLTVHYGEDGRSLAEHKCKGNQGLGARSSSLRRTVFLYFDGGHYWNIDFNKKPWCERCGLLAYHNHRCKAPLEPNKSSDEAPTEGLAVDMEVCDETRPSDTTQVGTDDPAQDWARLREAVFEKQTHVLLDGPGGTGKSFLVGQIVVEGRRRGKQVLVTASTGLAALNIDGCTVHSAVGLGAGDKVKDHRLSAERREALLEADVLVLDEVSMVGGSLLTRIDAALRRVRQSPSLFGGLQVVLVGDVMQLPPVHDSFFFNSEVYALMSERLTVVSLRTSRRFDDPAWFAALLGIRHGRVSEAAKRMLEERVGPCADDDVMRIFGHVRQCDAYNGKKYDALLAETRAREMRYASRDAYGRQADAAVRQELGKLWAQELSDTVVVADGCPVLVTRNVPSAGLANGTRGTVVGRMCSDDAIAIKVRGRVYWVERVESVKSTSAGATGTRSQFPLVLAWALTIHRCQGLTLDAVCLHLDASNVWEGNMAYVALSRVKSVAGLWLETYEPAVIHCHPMCLAFDRKKERVELDDLVRARNSELRPEDQVMTYRQKSSKRSLDHAKVLYFDLETYPHPDNNRFVPYFAAARLFEQGREVERVKYHDRDVSSTFFGWIVDKVIEDSNRYERRQRGKHKKDRESIIVNRQLRKPIVLAAYNGGKFDMHFFVQYLRDHDMSNRFSLDTVFKGSDLVSLSMYDHQAQKMALQMHDLMHFLVGSLDRMHRCFVPESEVRKSHFPHEALVRLGYECTESNDVALQLDDWYGKDHEEVTRQTSEGRLDMEHFPLRDHLHSYGMTDVDCLVELYAAVESVFRSTLDQSVLNFSTAPGVAHHGFMSYLPACAIESPADRASKGTVVSRLWKLDQEQEEFVRSAVIAGKSYPRITAFESRDGGLEDYYAFLDVSGMYAACMKDNLYPYGKPKWASEAERAHVLEMCTQAATLPNREARARMMEGLPWFIGEITCRLHPSDLEPCVGFKESKSGKLVWDVCERTQCYSNVALAEIVKDGGWVSAVGRLMVWPESAYLFRSFIELGLKIKEDGARSCNQGAREVGKLLNNAAYGDTLKHDYHNSMVFVRTREQADRFLLNYTLVDAFRLSRNAGHIFVGDKVLQTRERLCSRPLWLGVFVLDYSKRMLNNISNIIQPDRRDGTFASALRQPLFGDTDSLLVHASALPRLGAAGLLRNECGFLVDDKYDAFNKTPQGPTQDFALMQFAKIIECHSPAPKVYAIRYLRPPEFKEAALVKCKGIPRGEDVHFEWNGERRTGQITIDVLKQLASSDSTLTIFKDAAMKRVMYRLSRQQVSRMIEPFDIERTGVKRTLFKTKWSGRRPIDDEHPHVTVPLSWQQRRRLTPLEVPECMNKRLL